MKTTETMAKPTTVTATTVAPTMVAPAMVKPTTVKPTMPKNVQERPRASKSVQERPTKVTPTRVIPTSATQDMEATLRLQADKCHAFADAEIPMWDSAFKTSSLRKAWTEMPKTFLELVRLKEILDSVAERMSVGRNSKGDLELMKAALSAQFTRYEISWENSMWDVSGDDALFDEFVELYETVNEAVEKADTALYESKKFLQENSVQTSAGTTPSASCTNGNTRLGGTFSALKSKF